MIYFGLTLFALYLVFKMLYIVFPFARGQRKEPRVREGKNRSFGILVPAYNEENVIINCVRSLCELEYPKYSAYIIDDGSTDKTLELLERYLCLAPYELKRDPRLKYNEILSTYRSRNCPNIFVLSKKNGGKADALNAGIAVCEEEIVITLDADCMLKEDSLTKMNGAFQNGMVVAAGGAVHITQSVDSRSKGNIVFKLKDIIKYQVMQYMIAFYLHKSTQSRLRSLIVISGAYGAFNKELLITLGGYRKSVGEDMDITLKVQQYINTVDKKLMISFVPQSICFTECPESFGSLFKQRIRWQKAFVDCAIKYGPKMFRKFGASISLFFIFDYLILGTLTTFLFLLVPVFIALSAKVYPVFFIMLFADFVFGVIECLASKKAAAMNNFTFSGADNLRVNLFIPLKMFFFRLMNILFVVTGTLLYFVSKHHWNKAERLGRAFADTAAPVRAHKVPAKADYRL